MDTNAYSDFMCRVEERVRVVKAAARECISAVRARGAAPAVACVLFVRQTRGMTRDVLETAVREGIPFVIKMADGEKYEVHARDRIIVGVARVVLMDDRDIPHVLPMLTMTGVSYLPKENGSAV